MKHITLAIALTFACISANAASIYWGSDGTVARFLIDGAGGTGSSNRLATGSLVALVYLGNETSFSFDNTQKSYSESNNGISGGTVVATLNLTSKGTGQDSYTFTPYTSMNGNYGMIYFEAESWDKISDGTRYGMTTGVQTVNLASEIDNTQTAYLTSNTGLTGAIAVPEPSTAALALAGLALLLKRRKA